MRRLWMLGLLSVVACHCDDKADEEILAERTDTASVHLYVAAKVALTLAFPGHGPARPRPSLLQLRDERAVRPRLDAVAESDLVQLFTRLGADPLNESQSDNGIAGHEPAAKRTRHSPPFA